MADEFNDDEKVPPSWMNKKFFEMVLRNYEKDDTIVITSDLKVSPASHKSDHLVSIMFRVLAEYSSNSKDQIQRSMIVKTIPEVEGFKKELLDQVPVFETEISMYVREMPKFEYVLRKHGDNTQLCAKVLYHSLKPFKVIVFEDLVSLGYNCIRDRLINVEEVKACLSTIAKWHAVSYKLAEEGDEFVKEYKDGMVAKPKAELPLFITGGLHFLAESVAKVEGLEMYANKLRTLDQTLIEKCNDIFHAYRKGRKGIMVLNHGDVHARNIMFKYDKNNKLEDIMLIDFQISCYAPAVVDISYIIYMLLSEELRKNHREEFIHYYFSKFLETLKNIEYAGEQPTLADFYIDLYRFKEYEIWVMATFLPMVHSIISQEGKIGSEELFSTYEARCKMYLNPDYIAELRWLLPRFLHNGYLD